VSGANDAPRAYDDDGTNLLWARLPDGLDSFENSRVEIFGGVRI
jgi:hypothetical protein